MKRERQSVLSIRLKDDVQAKLLALKAHLIVKHGVNFTMTNVVEAAIESLAKREKIGAK